MGKIATITRRTFLIGAVAITGGVVFGYWKYKQPFGNPLLKDLGEDEAVLTPYVLIDQNGISIIAPRAEMGQGVHTTLAAMVAEELDVSLEQVNVIHGPASNAYFNHAVFEESIPFAAIDYSSMANRVRNFTKVPAKFLGMQMTGGSSSTPDAYEKMRVAGAAARESLVKAAAARLGVDAATLSTEQGYVISADGERIAYTALAEQAATIEPSAEPTLKPQSNWKVLGKSQNRVDMIPKCTGTATFGVDVTLPNMLYASIKVNPHLLSKMNGFDASKAESMRGVKKVVALDNGVAVIATNSWYAFQALKAIDFDWAPADYPSEQTELAKLVAASFNDDQQDSQNRNDGDVDAGLKQGEIIAGEYSVPYLAHATMEPMNATAYVHDGQIEIWAGNQIPTQVAKEAQAITGFDEQKITVHTTLMGGGFGRRLEMDYAIQAVKVAMAMEGTPIKLTWTREEDMTHDYYRPMAMAKFEAVMGDNGPATIDLKVAAPSVFASQFGRLGFPVAGPDVTISQSSWDQPYGIENYRVTAYKSQMALPVSSWRSVGASQNAFFHESMMDELALAKGLDPIQMRLDLLTHEPSRKVLEAVKKLSNWGSDLPAGHARGVAFCVSFGVPTAEVIEIAMQGEKVKIVNAYAAVDVGTALDPRNIEAQVVGGLNFGLAAAMSGEITVKGGKVEQTNFHNYTSIRMNQAPNVKVAILENGRKIRGIGEPGTPPAAPALANAIFAATGKRLRHLPLNKEIDFV